MKNKNFLKFLFIIVVLSIVLIIFRQHKPEAIKNIVSTTHQQIQNFKDNLRDAEAKTLMADEKYLNVMGFGEKTRLFPENVWRNTSLPIIVTYVKQGQESQAVGLVNNVAKILPNHTILIYNLGLDNYGLKTILNYCNNTRCQVIKLDLSEFPSHVEEDNFRAYRPLIVQDALRRAGAVFFMDCSHRLTRQVTPRLLHDLFNDCAKGSGILAWPMTLKNPVSSRTHKKMFEYFRTDAESFLFLQMIDVDVLLLVNTKTVHFDVMLPWIQCSLTQDCLAPIGAQSAGCRFDKKPQYRYSGCHNYDVSALNIVLGLKFKLDSTQYTYNGKLKLFKRINLNKAVALLRELELNTTTNEGKSQQFDTTW